MKWEAYWCSMPSNARYAGRSPQCSRSNIEWWRDVDDVDSKDDDEDSNNDMMMMKMMPLIILMIPHDWQGSDGCWIFQKETLLQHSSFQNFENNDFLLITPFFFSPDTRSQSWRRERRWTQTAETTTMSSRLKKNKHKTPNKYTQTQTQTAGTTRMSSRFNHHQTNGTSLCNISLFAGFW